jgi:hypothetical protein
MDPRERADAALARARARGAFVVTPESAISPMDAASTLQIPRVVVSENDDRRRSGTENPLFVSRSEAPEPTRDNIPAIAQEAHTDVVGSPRFLARQRRLEEQRARMAEAQAQPAQPDQSSPPTQPTPAQSMPLTQSAPPPKPPRARQAERGRPARPAEQQPPRQRARPAAESEEVDGLIPTTKQPPSGTGSLSQRLDG